ncbi:macoilin-2-like isoform X2 [Trichogramma pretiosum]|uniref:macoilin-2-like isoform X2 n=1 Tax=Trichogramma pretiosum TaxID=7493 RepID=UPI0006C95002|nr:macoilin-2-like isoform X2 [Trichogramma pretiosum]
MTDLLLPAFQAVVGSPPGGKSEVVFRTPGGAGQLFRNSEMRHSRSEDLLQQAAAVPRSPSPSNAKAAGGGGGGGAAGPAPLLANQAVSEDDLHAASSLDPPLRGPSAAVAASLVLRAAGGPAGSSPGLLADRVDPEDSIRDIVTENDLYRFVLFKRHYDKYVALAARYEEARGLAYYLEERYHEVKAERDRLEETREQLERRLEGCEAELKDKEEELFSQLERSLRLEDEAERARAEREACQARRERLEREQAATLRQLQLQAAENEITRRSLERARQEVIKQATAIRLEKDALEQENEALKNKLRAEQDELGAERRRNEEGVAALAHEANSLRHAARHLRAAALHATNCRRRRRCSVCAYARRTFQDVDDRHRRRRQSRVLGRSAHEFAPGSRHELHRRRGYQYFRRRGLLQRGGQQRGVVVVHRVQRPAGRSSLLIRFWILIGDGRSAISLLRVRRQQSQNQRVVGQRGRRRGRHRQRRTGEARQQLHALPVDVVVSQAPGS